jgi:hypothetical protein
MFPRRRKDGAVPVIEVWLLGGPADGRIMSIETNDSNRRPSILDLPQTGVYLGSNDQPTSMAAHRYQLEDTISEPSTYRYGGSVA